MSPDTYESLRDRLALQAAREWACLELPEGLDAALDAVIGDDWFQKVEAAWCEKREAELLAEWEQQGEALELGGW